MDDLNSSQALESVFKEEYGRLFTLAFRMTGTKENAEDALQTAFLNALSSLDAFRGEAALSTWVYRIVINASNALNRESRRLPVAVYAEENGITEAEVYRHIASFGSAEDETLINRTREACCQMFMDCMPRKLRAVYTLRGILQLSTKDTAEILETTEASVKVEFHRARRVIEQHTEGRCSLVKPGSHCDCRAYAEYLRRMQRTQVLIDVATVYRNEANAKTKFLLEMGRILRAGELYENDPQPTNYARFKERLKQLRAEESLSLLNS